MHTEMEDLRYPIGRYKKPETYNLTDIKEWVEVLDALPGWLDLCIENLDEEQLRIPYRPAGWNTNQVIHHIADSHMNAYIRVKLALTEDNPTIKTYKEAEWALLPDVEIVPVNVSNTLIHALHRRWVATLKALQPEEWDRTFYHPEHQRNIPIWEVTALYAWHSRHHMEQIRRLSERMNW